jgi:plastocyanin
LTVQFSTTWIRENGRRTSDMSGSASSRLVRSIGAFLLFIAIGIGAFALPGSVTAHGDPHPAHIHVGDCSAPGDVVGPLGNLEYAEDGGHVAWSTSSVELTLEDILAEPHSIVVHESEENISNYQLCGDITGEPGMDGSLNVALGELNGSGKAGVAVLTPTDAGTDVTVIAIEDGMAHGTVADGDEAAHPSHIHNGTCDASADVVYPLTDIATENGVGSAATDVETTIADLTAAPHAIIAHASADDMGTYIICGDITGTANADGVLAVSLGELSDSGHVGVAILTEADGMVNVQVYLVPGAAGGMGMASPEAGMEGHDMGAMEGDVEATIEGFAFAPGTIEVKVGTTITWTNNDSAPHTVTANDRSFDSGRMEQGQTFSFTFETAGEFAYFCEYHPGMVGTVVVTE